MADTTIAGNKGRVLQRTRSKPSAFTARTRKQFLDALAATCNVTLAARAAGKAVGSCYRLRQQDAGFAQAWDAALAMGYERLEAALLEYALNRMARDGADLSEIDPSAVDPAVMAGSVVQALADRTVSNADLQFALSLLNRHRAAAEGRRTGLAGKGRATAEETDAALRRKLDSLARRLPRR